MPTTTSPLTPATHGLRVAALFNPAFRAFIDSAASGLERVGEGTYRFLYSADIGVESHRQQTPKASYRSVGLVRQCFMRKHRPEARRTEAAHRR
jgi:hypothetical protein